MRTTAPNLMSMHARLLTVEYLGNPLSAEALDLITAAIDAEAQVEAAEDGPAEWDKPLLPWQQQLVDVAGWGLGISATPT